MKNKKTPPQKLNLDELRSEIDGIDSEILNLIAKRINTVSKVATYKHENGIPVYFPEREQDLLENRKQQAQKLGISGTLVEEVLRRIIKESYTNESKIGFKKTGPANKEITIIGGNNGMGKFFYDYFKLSQYKVNIIDKGDWDNLEEYVKNSSLVLVAVPINITNEIILRLKDKLPKECILADVTSTKSDPLAQMLLVHKGPVVGFHPMFGPSSKVMAKQVVVICPGRMTEKYQWLLDQLSIWGAVLLNATEKEHDHSMAIIQALRHLATFVYGYNLKEEKVPLDRILEFSSPIYRLELSMVGRLFAQDPELYADIIFSSKEVTNLVQNLIKRFQEIEKILTTKNKSEFKNKFVEISHWFDQYAVKFLDESSYMLEKVHEQFVPSPVELSKKRK